MPVSCSDRPVRGVKILERNVRVAFKLLYIRSSCKTPHNTRRLAGDSRSNPFDSRSSERTTAMTNLFSKLIHDEAGFIVSAELVLVATVGVLSMIVGLSEIALNVNNELEDVGSAFGSITRRLCRRVSSATKATAAGPSSRTTSITATTSAMSSRLLHTASSNPDRNTRSSRPSHPTRHAHQLDVPPLDTTLSLHAPHRSRPQVSRTTRDLRSARSLRRRW